MPTMNYSIVKVIKREDLMCGADPGNYNLPGELDIRSGYCGLGPDCCSGGPVRASAYILRYDFEVR